MNAKVIKRFKDKYTGEIFLPGVFYEGTEERIKELIAKNKVELINDSSSLTKKEIQLLLSEKGIKYDVKSNKADLITLLGDFRGCQL